MLKKIFSFSLFLAILFCFSLIDIFYSWNNGLLNIYFLNVGQGDSILIKTPSEKIILVDGGPRDVSLVKETIPFWVERIDLMVITHPHSDHIAGLIDALDSYTVERVLMFESRYESRVYDELLRRISDEQAIIIPTKSGQEIYVDDGVLMTILFPIEGWASDNINNNSVVARLSYGEFSLFLGGDIESSVENLISNLFGYGLESFIMKASHHGSKTSSSDTLIELIRPFVSIISVGNNNFGHPSNLVLNRLEKRNIKYYRTDVHGTISILTDGEMMSLKYEK